MSRRWRDGPIPRYNAGMASHPSGPVRFSIEEYLKLERDASEKHEYFDGEIDARAGGTEQHSLIITNLIVALHPRLRGKSCRLYESNLRVRIPRTPAYAYPDLSVVCGPTQFDEEDGNRTTIVNPRVLIEVLSPSTELYDRGRKFQRCLQLESLEEYVLVSQEAPAIETFFRRGDGTWVFTPANGLAATSPLRSLDVELPLAEVYAGVGFPPVAPDSSTTP